jgi:8-oxo-dGTP diphosphatase
LEAELKKSPTVVPVVAVALIDPAGRVLLQLRPQGKAHAGLWEFPGGKVEPGETLEGALVRETQEELGIELERAALIPIGFASDPAQPPQLRQPHLILLFACRDWSGTPRPLDAEAIDWFAPGEIMPLAMPPLDRPLAEALLRTI